jgi:tripartite-type tricarboxylate transporter receptor subunit TctC
MSLTKLCVALVISLLPINLAYAAEEEFYRGKTIHSIVGTGAGGGFDAYSRTLARHMSKYIPGNPVIVVDNMPGAGFLRSVQHLYKVAKPDGLTIGNWIGTLVMAQLIGRKAVDFDARKFEYIGSPVQNHDLCVMTKGSGITSVDKWMASKTPVKLGATPPGATTYDTPAVLKEALGLPTQIVAGYTTTRESRLAAESGEVAGLCGWSWASVKSTWPKGLETGEAVVVLQNAPKAHPELANVPLAISLAKTGEARKLIQAGIHDVSRMTYIYSFPPGTPKSRVQVLRRAFMETMKDPPFLAETDKAKLDLEPIGGEALENVVKEFFDVEDSIVKKFAKILQ